ncbi:hypothetical protein GJAV_G00117180 [Gymnothorax javanicus]|nr:hypothetical protein GJAV_G00117180 [Gymnothorax javanicus]
MEHLHDQNVSLGSPCKHSYFGSFLLPPGRTSPPVVDYASNDPMTSSAKLQELNMHMHRTTTDAGSRAVIAALKTLQEKIRRLELERVQAERDASRLCQRADRDTGSTPGESGSKETGGKEGRPNQELAAQLRSAEARCSILEKQLDFMRSMMKKAEQDRNEIIQQQESVHRERQTDQTEVEAQLQKLELLERECQKLSNTQSVAEMKIELLERKLLKEEHERKLVQEKAAELQRSLEMNRALYSSISAGVKPKKKKKTPLTRKTAAVAPLHHPFPKAKPMPFVAGMSTGPSHSVSANVQSVLHMLKFHHPQLCDRVHYHKRSNSETVRGPQKAPSVTPGPRVLGNLSELLLALQDELGQMSFEEQELVKRIEGTRKPCLREELERELDCLLKRMEEKGTQISQLKKHQLVVQKLKRRSRDLKRRAASADCRIGASSKPKSLTSSPTFHTPQRTKGKSCLGNRSDRPRLKGPVRIQTNLKKDDIVWET